MDIDTILDLLDSDRTLAEQQKGIEYARKTKHLEAFMQPRSTGVGAWDNCALIVSEKEDEELLPYLSFLFTWIQDINWPGALRIIERLKKFGRTKRFIWAYECAIDEAKKNDDFIWLANLEALMN